MTILEHISQTKLDARMALDGWADGRTIERGREYVDRVIELAATENLLAGVVKGTTCYFTNVRLEENGELESICSCPVGRRCKHSVALILKARQMLGTQSRISSSIPAEWTTRPLERAREVERKREEKRRQRRLEEEKRAAQRAYEEECERKRDEAFLREFNTVRENVLAACRNASLEKVKETAEAFLGWVNDDDLYRYPHLSHKIWDAVDPTMDIVFETFEAKSVDPVDTIIWAYELNAPDQDLSVGNRLEALLSSPTGKYAQPMVWEAVALCIQKKVDEIPEDDYSVGDCNSSPWYWVEALCAAWKRAGNDDKVIDCYLKFVSRIGNWLETAQFLNEHQLYDKAIEVAREGVRASQTSGDYGNDYEVEMQEPLADAFSGKGDHLMATAILAEAFLDRIGGYDKKRTVAQFNRILSEAEKAGIGEQVRSQTCDLSNQDDVCGYAAVATSVGK